MRIQLNNHTMVLEIRNWIMEFKKFQLLNSQPIHTIRVWGVGRDNSRDFAYVARDKQTRRHLCHVFRCDTQARSLANALRLTH